MDDNNFFYMPPASNQRILPLFEEISGSFLDLYTKLLERVKEKTGQTDESALQATTYTVWRVTWDEIAKIKNKPVMLIAGDPIKDLQHFQENWMFFGDNAIKIFTTLLVIHYGEEGVSMETATKMMNALGEKFYEAKNFFALAQLVRAKTKYLMGEMKEKDYESAKENLMKEIFGPQEIYE